MSLFDLFSGIFRGLRFNGQLDKIREQGRKDARAAYSAYLGGVQEEADELLRERQQKLIGVEPKKTLACSLLDSADHAVTRKRRREK